MMYARKVTADRWEHKLTPKVHLKWQVRGIPCIHAIACITTIRADIANYCSPYFTTEMWRKTFEQVIHPIPDESMWPQFNDEELLPPVVKKPSGRSKKHRRRRIAGEERPLPPTSRKQPTKKGPNPHVTLARFAKIYGPDLFSFKLGTKLVIVGSTPAAAMAILKTHDRSLCARFVPHVAPSKCQKKYDSTIGWVDECNESWKNLRSFTRTELFSGKAINSQALIRDKKVNETVNHVAKHMQGKEVKVREIAFGAVLNMMGNILVSKDMIEQSNESLKGELCEIMNKITDVASSPNISDFYPILGPFDLQNLQKRSMELFDRSCQLWEAIVKERKASETSSPSPPDFLDSLIQNGHSTLDINNIFMT
ncbi:hypothetical protein F8388_016622 [Cannabis sativa]|uniref:Zinc finger PMZ-type domain-containing protein n=1 Tax=Cannabis sativa TaxID=3483 RepID=A0A7J6FD33_CANSA|nr:hypothetical protein F8388_016622 [Cannabis sativa]